MQREEAALRPASPPGLVLPPSGTQPKPGSVSPSDLPSGLTVFTLITAKRQLGGLRPRLAHLAIGPRVNLRQVVQLQALLALAQTHLAKAYLSGR